MDHPLEPLKPDESRMLLTTNAPRRRLLLQATATLALLLLVGFTVLMHSMLGHTTGHEHAMTMSSSVAADQPHGAGDGHMEHVAAPAGAVMTSLSAAGCDGGLCALMCSLMGMACALTITLFAWALLRARNSGVLYVLARLLALADRVARRIAAPKPPSLTALQIIRI